jgi:1-acyl-sn-glycerol-3-phosphate acyltransferase
MGTLIKLSKAIPIDLEANDASWYVTGEEILREGGAMLIFPEGGIAREGEMLPFKSGAGMLCAKTDAVLVPMAIYGSYKMPFGRRQRLYVGKPIDCRCPENVRYSAYARQLMKDAQSEVEELYGIPESKYGRLEVYYHKSYAEK